MSLPGGHENNNAFSKFKNSWLECACKPELMLGLAGTTAIVI